MDEKFFSLWPLILFTVLLPVAAGLAAGAALAVWLTDIASKDVLTALWWALGLTVLSGVLVSFHLGHVERSMSAVRGIKHSNLSHEILLAYGFGFLLAAGIICIYMSGPEILIHIVLVLGGVLGLAAAFSIGRVYKLPAQISWRGNIPSLGPFIGSMLTAVVIFYVLAGAFDAPMVFGGAFWLFLALDGIFTAKRFGDFLSLKHSQYIMVYPRQKTVVNFCYGLKLMLTAGVVVLFIREYYTTVLMVVGLGMLLDRTAFYASAARKTPKVNIAIAKDERMRAALNSQKG